MNAKVVGIVWAENRLFLFFSGKLITSIVTGIAHRRPQGESYDQAIRNDATGLWQCPFCQQDNFPELSEVTNPEFPWAASSITEQNYASFVSVLLFQVWNHFDSGSCPGQAIGVRSRLDNGVQGFIPTKFLSDKVVKHPEERVKVSVFFFSALWKRSCLLVLCHLCDPWLVLVFGLRLVWRFTVASWRLTLRNSAWTSHAALQIWWTRQTSGNSPRTATMTLTQSLKTKNRTRSWKRNSREHVRWRNLFKLDLDTLMNVFDLRIYVFTVILTVFSFCSVYKARDRPP